MLQTRGRRRPRQHGRARLHRDANDRRDDEEASGGKGRLLRGGDRTSLEEERPGIVQKRRGEAEEVAAAIALLVSERASFVNGANMRVEGGSVQAVQN
ncbi:SDR family oxidoreductase [Aureimonas sp. Leaf324]|uniref:SDR family oxidoreductase n=1 Tax=Aureimonas sp. Leaf324 TaxID=1736336 RepID=UPI0032974215